MVAFGASDMEHFTTRGEAGRRRLRLPRPLLIEFLVKRDDAKKREVAARVPIHARDFDMQRVLTNISSTPTPRCNGF